jgi:transposase
MSATHATQSTTAQAIAPRLDLALELGWNNWRLAFGTPSSPSVRQVTICARDLAALTREIRRARLRFGLPDDAPVRSVYEAGRDGFWLHRALVARGVENIVVESSAIEVDRRARRAKNDAIDAARLLGLLQRHFNGEANRLRVVRVPAPEDEDRRHQQREHIALQEERTRHSNAIKGHLAMVGLSTIVDAKFPERLAALRQWNGEPLPCELHGRLLREYELWKLVDSQLRTLLKAQLRRVRDDATPHVEQVRQLLTLKGIGPKSTWLLVHEIFGWRRIRNRRQLGALVGLIPSPYDSGQSRREQGISKAGNRRVRWMCVELAWMWLQYQPRSALAEWYQRRFGQGNARARKVGIVALARKLLVALWKYLEFGEVPEGAELMPWNKKLNGRVLSG